MTTLVAAPTNTIDFEIAAFESMKSQLEASSLDKWVIVHGGRVEGTFNEFDEAAAEAVSRFGRGPFLLRLVGEKPPVLPASVVWARQH